MTGEKLPTILIVDDEQINLMVSELILRKEGYHTISACSGIEAIELAKSQMPDLILLDVMMPEVDGFETCAMLKRDSKTAGIPVIFLSALHDIANRLRAIDSGAADYMSKPFSKAEALTIIRQHLKPRPDKVGTPQF